MNLLARFGALAALLVLTACGGGGGSSGSCGFSTCSSTTPPGTAPVPVASDISLTLSTASVSNSGSATVTATVTAVDGNRNTIAGIPVQLRVDNGATVSVSSSITSGTGVVTGIINIGSDRSNRAILVTATSGSLTKESMLQVVGSRLTGTALPAVLTAGAAGSVQYQLVDANNNPMAGLPISISGVAGAEVSATTGINGDYTYRFTAPASGSTLDIRAQAAGVETTNAVLAGGGTIDPVPAGSVLSSSLRASPSVVPVNASVATANRTEVRALFVGTNNRPIRNVRVRFDLNGDTNSVGGTFTSGTTTVFSDANGEAIASYVPGPRFSPTDGLTLRACWSYADFPVGTCPNQTTTTLTVISDSLSVSIGADEFVTPSDLTYSRRFVVQVNDSSGLAKPDVLISPLLDLTKYIKGIYSRQLSSEQGRWVRGFVIDPSGGTTTFCANEDLNRNGVLEVYGNGTVEDANNNRQLDPRKADVVVSFEGSNRTNAAGQVRVRITYPRSHATWIEYMLTVAAGGVAGTEGRASTTGILGAPETGFTDSAEPAFRISPYGVQASRTVSPLLQNGEPSGVLLCINPN